MEGGGGGGAVFQVGTLNSDLCQLPLELERRLFFTENVYMYPRC